MQIWEDLSYGKILGTFCGTTAPKQTIVSLSNEVSVYHYIEPGICLILSGVGMIQDLIGYRLSSVTFILVSNWLPVTSGYQISRLRPVNKTDFSVFLNKFNFRHH